MDEYDNPPVAFAYCCYVSDSLCQDAICKQAGVYALVCFIRSRQDLDLHSPYTAISQVVYSSALCVGSSFICALRGIPVIPWMRSSSALSIPWVNARRSATVLPDRSAYDDLPSDCNALDRSGFHADGERTFRALSFLLTTLQALSYLHSLDLRL